MTMRLRQRRIFDLHGPDGVAAGADARSRRTPRPGRIAMRPYTAAAFGDQGGQMRLRPFAALEGRLRRIFDLQGQAPASGARRRCV